MVKLGWRRWHPVIREWLIIAFVLSVGLVAAIEQGWFYRFDQTLYDQSLSLWARPADRDIVIVGVDEDSLKQLGRWPLRRGIDATLINALSEAGAKVIVMDVILTETDNRDPAGDTALAAALRNSPRIVLPVIQTVSEGVPVGESMPASPFAEAARHAGHTHARIDADGILRSAFLYAGYGSPRHDLLSLAGWALAEPERVALWRQRHPQPGEEPPGAAPQAWVIQDPYLIPFAGPPGHFTVVSAIDVLRRDVPLSMFKDKIVLLGSTASGSGDEYPTPVSGLTRAMPGVEIHANVLQGLRQGIDLQLAPHWITAFVSWLILLTLLAAFVRLSPRQALLLTVILCVSAMIATALLFRLGQVWMSPVVLVLTMMIAYPVWSWRKLEAAQRYLDAELVRLQNEQTLLPQPARKQGPSGAPLSDVIERRISAVQEAGQLLRDLNRFVADSLESLPEAAIVTDAGGKIRLVNSSAARLFGGSGGGEGGHAGLIGSVIGSDVLPLLADFKQAAPRPWTELLNEAVQAAQVTSLEVKAPDESEYLLQIAPSFTHAGARAGTIITLTDISPLRESERRRDEALRFLSHDMRSPQASILTLLEMQAAAPEMMTTAVLLERIGKYSRRTLNLADDFLRLAKAERSRAQDFSVVALDEVLQDAVEEAWSLASTKKIRIEIVGNPDLPTVSGDRDLLTRAIINLLSNAIKYSPEDTVIQCSVNVAGEGGKDWRVDVADQGFGITPDGLSKLFTRFVRLHTEQQPEVDGIGLGLVFVKTVVEKHNGSVSVQSKVAEKPGDPHGTTFSLTIPALPPEEDE